MPALQARRTTANLLTVTELVIIKVTYGFPRHRQSGHVVLLIHFFSDQRRFGVGVRSTYLCSLGLRIHCRNLAIQGIPISLFTLVKTTNQRHQK